MAQSDSAGGMPKLEINWMVKSGACHVSCVVSCGCMVAVTSGCIMSSANHKPCRDWREIAENASHEKDRKKLGDLAVELERALEERDKKLKQKSVTPKGKGDAA